MTTIFRINNANTVNNPGNGGIVPPHLQEPIRILPMPEGWEEPEQPAGDGYKLVRDCGMARA